MLDASRKCKSLCVTLKTLWLKNVIRAISRVPAKGENLKQKIADFKQKSYTFELANTSMTL